MLTTLKIQNLILVESAQITFGEGLNILTGETGSGKSALLSALSLLSGQRADTGLIRKESDLAIVEATFQTDVSSLLQEEEILPPTPPSPLHVRREIHRSGKSRCFIEDQQVSLTFLRKCIGHIIEQVDQSSSHTLASQEEQRHMLDTFSSLLPLTKELQQNFQEQKKLEEALAALIQKQEIRERELAWAQKDVALIEETNWKEGEEETLTQEHHRLIHAQELLEKVSLISTALSDGNQPIASLLKRFSTLLEQCQRLDPSLSPLATTLKSTAVELEEISSSLQSYLDRLEIDPKRLQFVEERIAALETLKRRFGASFEAVQAKRKELLAQIEKLENLDEEIQNLQKKIQQLANENEKKGALLSDERKKGAAALEMLVQQELKPLNLPHARFVIHITSKPLTAQGIDDIQFLFSANLGVPPAPLEQCASGGELSRLLLALKICLSEKGGASCLVFDEIDSNVGGQTATILGEKLKKLSHNHQVICVTHFSQVARQGMHHFLVTKNQEGGLAKTTISPLSSSERESEYKRMLGEYSNTSR